MSTDDLYAKEWIEFYDNLVPESHYRSSFKKLHSLIKTKLPFARKVLELACSTGRYSNYFVKNNFVVHGLDLSKSAIEHAKVRVPKAKFKVDNMVTFQTNQSYDIVACMFESFRYHKSYAQALQTLKRSFNALNANGLFFCDFGVYPISKMPEKPQIHNEVKMSKGRLIVRDETIITKNNFDTRFDHLKIYKRNLFRKNTLLREIKINRDPLLRLSIAQMKELMARAGFKKIQVIKSFSQESPPNFSILFVGQKVVSIN